MQIGEVAERTGLTPRTLRYWEEIGLLPPAERLEGGFRLYSAADLERLTRIVQLKKLLGFSLSEVRRVVEAEEELRLLRERNRSETDPADKRALRAGDRHPLRPDRHPGQPPGADASAARGLRDAGAAPARPTRRGGALS